MAKRDRKNVTAALDRRDEASSNLTSCPWSDARRQSANDPGPGQAPLRMEQKLAFLVRSSLPVPGIATQLRIIGWQFGWQLASLSVWAEARSGSHRYLRSVVSIIGSYRRLLA